MTDKESNPSPSKHQPSPTPQTTFRFAIVSLFGSPIAKVAGIACLSLLLVTAVIAYTVLRHRSAERQSAVNANQHSSLSALSAQRSIAKPSPIGRAQPPQPSWSAPPPAPALPVTAPAPPAVASVPQPQNNAAAVPPPAAPPLPRVAPSLPFGMRFSADRDGFNNGCRHGQLVIETSTVTFTCPHDASKNVAVSARQVRDLDDNGIVVFPRQKYHFDIDGKQKQAVHELFAQWLRNARRAATERASN